MSDSAEKSKKPRDSRLTQQKLPAWQPILSPLPVACGFGLIFAVFTALGVVVLVETLNIVEIEQDYTTSCVLNTTNIYGAPNCKASVNFRIEKDMATPVYIYYKLENFYQNHRRYASSRSDTQLGGKYTNYGTIKSECAPITHYGVHINDDVPQGYVYNPCGLIAWSKFNDTFVLRQGAEIICNGPTPEGSKCTKTGIAWDSDKKVKFKKPEGDIPNWNTNSTFNATYFQEGGHLVPSVEDEDLIVWMRTAALPNFRKLYRIITKASMDKLPAGDYTIDIDQNFPVTEFGGKKKFVISTASWFGGKNMFLAIAYLVVAGICLVLCLVFLVGGIVQVIRNRSSHGV